VVGILTTLLFENQEMQRQDDGLSCSICFNDYDEASHLPVVAICGHSFCKSCSLSLPKRGGGGGRQTIQCPNCRMEATLPLSNNYSLISLLRYWRANVDGPSMRIRESVVVAEEQKGPESEAEDEEDNFEEEEEEEGIDEDLMRILISQNFFKDEGVYAWMLPEIESEEEDEELEFDDHLRSLSRHEHPFQGQVRGQMSGQQQQIRGQTGQRGGGGGGAGGGGGERGRQSDVQFNEGTVQHHHHGRGRRGRGRGRGRGGRGRGGRGRSRGR
jgi:hypothetical protein